MWERACPRWFPPKIETVRVRVALLVESITRIALRLVLGGNPPWLCGLALTRTMQSSTLHVLY